MCKSLEKQAQIMCQKILVRFCFVCHTDLMSPEGVPKSWLGVKSSSFIRLVRSSLSSVWEPRTSWPRRREWKCVSNKLTILSLPQLFSKVPWDLHAWRDTPRDLRGPHSEVEVRTWAMHYVMFNFPFNFSVLLIFPHFGGTYVRLRSRCKSPLNQTMSFKCQTTQKLTEITIPVSARYVLALDHLGVEEGPDVNGFRPLYSTSLELDKTKLVH